MTQITSHVLDTSQGKPAEGIGITLLVCIDGEADQVIGTATTNSDGRVSNFLETSPDAGNAPLEAGTYKLTFELADYFARTASESFYPRADIVFNIAGDGQHYHVPLLLNPFGYSTYRGS